MYQWVLNIVSIVSIVYFCLTSVCNKTYLTFKIHKYIYNCHSKRIVRDSKNSSSLDIYKSKTISKKHIHEPCHEKKTIIEISLIVNYKLNFKDDNIKLHMKSLSAALVPNRKARFSYVIVHESQIYTLFTQTHTYKGQTGVQLQKHLYQCPLV